MLVSSLPLFKGLFNFDASFESLGGASDGVPRLLAFCESKRYLSALRDNSYLAAVVTRPEYAGEINPSVCVIATDNPRELFFLAHDYLLANTDFYDRDFGLDISVEASIHPSAVIAEDNVKIGAGAVVEARAVIGRNTVIGDGARVMPGAVVGFEGVQILNRGRDQILAAHAGGVMIGPGVSIGAGCVINKALFGHRNTIIGGNTIIGANTVIGHGCKLGPGCFVASGVVVGGGVELGEMVTVGLGAVLGHGLSVGTGATIGLGALVKKSLPPGLTVYGETANSQETLLERERRQAYLDDLYCRNNY